MIRRLTTNSHPLQYDRDMRTATQAEEMRSRLSKLEDHATPAFRLALSRVRAVLKSGSVASLAKARDMLYHAAQTESSKPSGGAGQMLGEERTRLCEPNCGRERNVFNGIDTTKYPYDERYCTSYLSSFTMLVHGLVLGQQLWCKNVHANGLRRQDRRYQVQYDFASQISHFV